MTNLPKPVSRQDKLLHNIADETPSIEDLVPNCREEVYLKYIAINGAAKKEIPLKIEHGGTEAVNSEQARENLGVYSKSEINTMVSDLSENYYNKSQTDDLLNSKANTSDLSQVATSGQYSDLSGLPSIPSKTSDLTNDSNFISSSELYESCYNKTQIDNFLTNKANSSHEHSASDITSGILPVSRGGTGQISLTSGNILLGNGDSAITSTSCLSIDKGGTGSTTESNARSNLSVYSKSETDTLLSSKAPYEIKSSTDFNSMTTPGLYTMRSSSTNSPSGGSYHSLIVLKSDTGNYVQQLAIKESTTQMYLRYLSGSNWSDWSQVGSSSSSEFGTWTPTIGIEGPSGLTVSYDGGYRYGIYYNVNRLVYVSCHIKFQITSLTTSYYASIYNLPFIPRGDGIDRVSLHCTECLNALENNVIPRGHLVINQDSHIHLQNEGGYMAVKWKTAGSDYQYLGFSGCYLKS